jgi:hypothetical protein
MVGQAGMADMARNQKRAENFPVGPYQPQPPTAPQVPYSMPPSVGQIPGITGPLYRGLPQV